MEKVFVCPKCKQPDWCDVPIAEDPPPCPFCGHEDRIDQTQNKWLVELEFGTKAQREQRQRQLAYGQRMAPVIRRCEDKAKARLVELIGDRRRATAIEVLTLLVERHRIFCEPSRHQGPWGIARWHTVKRLADRNYVQFRSRDDDCPPPPRKTHHFKADCAEITITPEGRRRLVDLKNRVTAPSRPRKTKKSTETEVSAEPDYSVSRGGRIEDLSDWDDDDVPGDEDEDLSDLVDDVPGDDDMA